MTATYVVEADWGRTGLYDHAESDITADVLELSLERGRDYASLILGQSVAGRALIDVKNQSGKYSRSNSAGDLAGLLEPGVPVRVRASSPSASTLWTGYLSSIEPAGAMTPGAVRKARLKCTGPLARLRALGSVYVAPQTNITTGAAIALVLDAAGWPKNAQPYVTDLTPDGQWGLGETSGDAIDLSGNGNDGTVTIGGGARGAAALDDEGDGAITFDGSATEVDVADDATLQNLYDGGGGGFVIWKPASLAAAQTIVAKGWSLAHYTTSGALRLEVPFSGTTGRWDTGDLLDAGTAYAVGWAFDADDVANNPTIWIVDLSTGVLTTCTVGSGLTESQTPVGTRTTDAGTALDIGHNAGSSNLNGTLDELALSSSTPSLAQFKGWVSRVLTAWRRIDTGQTTLPRWWVEDRNALAAIQELEETERGFLSEGADGPIVFEDRHHRLKGAHLSSQATFSDATAATLPYTELVPRDREQEIFNDVSIPVRHFTTQSLAVLWTYQGDALTIPSGESLTVWASYPPPATPAGRYVAAWTTPVVGTDITQTGVTNGDLSVVVEKFARAMKITVSNAATGPATLTLLQARGTAVTEDNTTFATAEDTGSKSDFGERSVPRPGAWHQDFSLAQAIADYLMSRYADPLEPIPIGFRFQATANSALMTQALTRALSDRITLVANGTGARGAQIGVDGDYFIESRRDVIGETGSRHEVFFDLSPASGDGGYWAVGETGFSELGETTRLAPP